MKAYNIFGLCYRSGKLIVGQDQVIAAIKQQKVKVIVMSDSASENTQKIINDKAKTYQCEIHIINDNGKLASAIGKKVVKVVATEDSGFGKLIVGKIKEINGK